MNLPTKTLKSKRQGVETSHTYTLAPLGAWQVLELTPQVTRLLAPVVANGAHALTENDWKAIEPALANSLGAMKPGELSALTREVLAGCTVAINGAAVDVLSVFDEHFKGRPAAMLQLLAWALLENFGDFSDAFTSLGSVAAARLGALAKATAKPNEPQGSVIPSKTSG